MRHAIAFKMKGKKSSLLRQKPRWQEKEEERGYQNIIQLLQRAERKADLKRKRVLWSQLLRWKTGKARLKHGGLGSVLNWLAQKVKKLSAAQETRVQSLGWEDPLEKKWQPTPVFLPEEFHGQRSLVGYSSWGCKESCNLATKPPPPPQV